MLFLDESGHDHKTMPYEVHGGIAVHDSRLWPFLQAVKQLELNCFGAQLSSYHQELKGCKLLDKKRFQFARQAPVMTDAQRIKSCRQFLQKGTEKSVPTSEEFCAYGQACIKMAEELFPILQNSDAHVFASVVPRGTPHHNQTFSEYLRKDHVFLFERFFYLLERDKEHGLIVMDEVQKEEDRRFARRMESYFTKTTTGRFRATSIIPSPFFVSSDMTYAVQVADIVIYCINLGFRLHRQGMNEPVRNEIKDLASAWIGKLQFRGDGYRDGEVFPTFGIVYVNDAYASRT
ncbi:MAG TPA: DUF3800 domain-containing protein [Opitutales bacterium]|nr:DUF3800 domain-containing protein [Opitutales bacterium]